MICFLTRRNSELPQSKKMCDDYDHYGRFGSHFKSSLITSAFIPPLDKSGSGEPHDIGCISFFEV
jgi:hypothetical protein